MDIDGGSPYREILLLLPEAVKHMVVEYDGAGDEGQIESIEYLDEDNNSVAIENEIDSKILDLLEKALYDKFGSWGDGEGEYGTLQIDFEAKEIDWSHHVRVIETIDTTGVDKFE